MHMGPTALMVVRFGFTRLCRSPMVRLRPLQARPLDLRCVLHDFGVFMVMKDDITFSPLIRFQVLFHFFFLGVNSVTSSPSFSLFIWTFIFLCSG